MVLYSFTIFDKHCSSPEGVLLINIGGSVYHRQWNTPTNQVKTPSFISPGPPVPPTQTDTRRLVPTTNKHEDDAKLLFGVVYSLRNMTRKLSTPYPPFHPWAPVLQCCRDFNSRKKVSLLIETTTSYLIGLQSINYITMRRRRYSSLC